MKQSPGEKLKGLGLDVEFLAWLEGEDQRLPDLEQVRKVKDADYAAAIRAAEWLAQYFADEERIFPNSPEQWLERYELLEGFLRNALGLTLFYHGSSIAQDLEALERVLKTLLPAESWKAYREDISHLRKLRLPERLPAIKPKPSGGAKQSERTWRMRAAVTYIADVSKTPYGDLARFWNERLSTAKYSAGYIKNRLRKGDPLRLTEGAVVGGLERWLRIYRGDLRDVFPGPFPLNEKMKAPLNRRSDR